MALLVLYSYSRMSLPVVLATVFLFLNETIDNLVGLLVECKDTFSAASVSDVFASWLALLLDCILAEDSLIGIEVSKSFLIELRPWMVDRLKNKRAPMGSKVANNVLSVM